MQTAEMFTTNYLSEMLEGKQTDYPPLSPQCKSIVTLQKMIMYNIQCLAISYITKKIKFYATNA